LATDFKRGPRISKETHEFQKRPNTERLGFKRDTDREHSDHVATNFKRDPQIFEKENQHHESQFQDFIGLGRFKSPAHSSLHPHTEGTRPTHRRNQTQNTVNIHQDRNVAVKVSEGGQEEKGGKSPQPLS